MNWSAWFSTPLNPPLFKPERSNSVGKFHSRQFPGESETYRQARDELMEAEPKLRRQIEDVAALRRRLPKGGKIKENYVFEEGAADFPTELRSSRPGSQNS